MALQKKFHWPKSSHNFSNPKVVSDTLATLVEKLLFIHPFLLIKAVNKAPYLLV